jgi:hypothetical protein
MSMQPQVPDWVRQFSYPDWTNVFQLLPNNDSLYPEALRPDWKVQFNDWNGGILLLAKDGCPTRVVKEGRDNGEPQPWRYAQQELGDEGGWRTNSRLYRFASVLPGGKLYGSATANMLYDDPGWSRSLPGFFGGPLHDFLKQVLSWVLESMPRVKWVACLGQEAWFLTCVSLGSPSAASRFSEYRDSYKPIVGYVARKRLAAFPLYHPGARVRTDLMERGWQEFVSLLSIGNNLADDHETRKPAHTHQPFITAALPKRQCRVQFMIDNKLVHISPQYKSCNTWERIIAYARSKRGGAPANLPPAAVAIPQVLTSAGWVLAKRLGRS